jgi:hypothetical protein
MVQVSIYNLPNQMQIVFFYFLIWFFIFEMLASPALFFNNQSFQFNTPLTPTVKCRPFFDCIQKIIDPCAKKTSQ